ncbi:MAG: hypothetical protein L6416_03230 [Candidatus Omnitrophica bacterium]|nr:hypothetical protein [Candidatus Omnitrophota bacterium]
MSNEEIRLTAKAIFTTLSPYGFFGVPPFYEPNNLFDDIDKEALLINGLLLKNSQFFCIKAPMINNMDYYFDLSI